MDNLFSDLKNTMGHAMKKSGELLDITRAKIAISETKAEINENYRVLGEKIYTAKKGNETLTTDFEAVIWKIDELYEVLKNHELKLAGLKMEKMCSSCNKSNADTAAYCSHCGAKFEEQETEEPVQVEFEDEE